MARFFFFYPLLRSLCFLSFQFSIFLVQSFAQPLFNMCLFLMDLRLTDKCFVQKTGFVVLSLIKKYCRSGNFHWLYFNFIKSSFHLIFVQYKWAFTYTCAQLWVCWSQVNQPFFFLFAVCVCFFFFTCIRLTLSAHSISVCSKQTMRKN